MHTLALLLLAAAGLAAVLLVVGLARPATFGGDRRHAGLIFGPIVAVLAVAGGVLLVLPHYEVTLAANGQPVVIGETTDLLVDVRNQGLTSGTYSGAYSLDGVTEEDVDLSVSGGATQQIALPLPEDLARGDHTATVGETTLSFAALRPARYVVKPFDVTPKLLKPGQSIKVRAAVTNDGDVPGTFDGDLKINGRVVDAQPTDVGPGETVDLAFKVKRGSPGVCRVKLGGESAKVVVVKPVRFANGYVIERHLGSGYGKLQIKNNKNRTDGVVVLTRAGSKSPLLAVYVHGRKDCTVSGIPDGSYHVFYWLGRDWNWYMHGFLTTKDRARFTRPMAFNTRAWTNTWTDAYYRYSQRVVQGMGWTITLYGVAGGTEQSVQVSAARFPRVK